MANSQSHSKCKQIERHKSSGVLLIPLLLAVSLSVWVGPAASSGVFEINFSSLVDAFGRDLRDDCCSWQNASRQQFNLMQQQSAGARKQLAPSLSSEPADEPCDPKKCQLIVRVCVKNHESQVIESSQCTFGELTAQVAGSPRAAAAAAQNNQNIHPSQNLNNFQHQNAFQLGGRAGKAQAFNSLSPTQTITSQNFNVHYQKLSQIHALQSQGQNLNQNFNQISSQAASSLKPAGQSLSLAAGQPRALRQISFNQNIAFPFNFTWPDSYSLVVDAWYESPTGLQQVAMQQQQQQHHKSQLHRAPLTLFDLYRKQFIIHHSIRGYLAVKDEWTNELHKTELASLAYSYRVTCQQNYFGEHCSLLCRPRDDVYGHYTCSPQGSVQCLAGWQGEYCDKPICLAGCNREQGNCSLPNECNCRYGWQGPTCDQCITHPGCVHGFCNKAHDCICQKGWTGALCNEEESICSMKQPCQNGAACVDSIDAEGKASYTCDCSQGFSGKNCEQRRRQDTNFAGEKQQLAIQANQTNNSVTAANKMRARNLIQQQQQQASLGAPAQLSEMPGPFFPQPITLSSQQQTLDRWLPEAYMVIIVCLVVLVLLLLVRLILERPSLRQYGWWADCEPAYSTERTVVGPVEDVATLQNHQNIYKSRGSIQSAEKNPYNDSLYGSSIGDSLASSMGSSSMGDRTLPRPPPHHHQSQQMPMMQHQQNNQQQNNSNNANHYQSRHLLHHHSYHNLHSSGAGRLSSRAAPNSSSNLNNLCPPPPPYQTVTASSNYAPTSFNYSTYGTHSLYGIPAQPAHPSARHLSPSGGRRALSQARLYQAVNSSGSNNTHNDSANNQQLYPAVSSNALHAAGGHYVIAYHIQPN